MTRQTYKTPELLFVQQAPVGGTTPFTYMTHYDAFMSVKPEEIPLQG